MRRNLAAAFKRTVCAFMPGAPEPVVAIEPVRRIVPAAVTDVAIDNAITILLKLGIGFTESGNQHHGFGERPRQPRQSRAKSDEKDTGGNLRHAGLDGMVSCHVYHVTEPGFFFLDNHAIEA